MISGDVVEWSSVFCTLFTPSIFNHRQLNKAASPRLKSSNVARHRYIHEVTTQASMARHLLRSLWVGTIDRHELAGTAQARTGIEQNKHKENQSVLFVRISLYKTVDLQQDPACQYYTTPNLIHRLPTPPTLSSPTPSSVPTRTSTPTPLTTPTTTLARIPPIRALFLFSLLRRPRRLSGLPANLASGSLSAAVDLRGPTSKITAVASVLWDCCCHGGGADAQQHDEVEYAHFGLGRCWFWKVDGYVQLEGVIGRCVMRLGLW